MAAFDLDFPDNFMSGLLEMDFDEVAEEALRKAAPILEESMKKSCRRVIEHGGESEMAESIAAAKPKKAKTGAWIVNVGPKGYSKVKRYRGKKEVRIYPVSNALKAIWKEYGVAGRQPPRPFITNAVNGVREAVMKRMQEVYDRKAGSG